jgi:hypothetical protein
MTQNNEPIDREESTELEELDPQPPSREYIRRDDFRERMDEVRAISNISKLASKLKSDTIADIISQAIHQQTAQNVDYNADYRRLEVTNMGADAVRPAHVVEALSVENWAGVMEAGRIEKQDDRTDEIVIKLW